MATPLQILQSHRLRITDCRLVIIQEFLDNKTFNYAVQEGVANVKEKGPSRRAFLTYYLNFSYSSLSFLPNESYINGVAMKEYCGVISK